MSQKDLTAWLMSWGNGNADAENRLMRRYMPICGRLRGGACEPNARITR
jgi:DNA-directed RNA polymerase specialized sigma subunit